MSDRSDIVRNSTPQDASIDEVAESHWPLVVMLVATQTAVGMIVLERLAWIISGIAGTTFSADATRWTLSVAFMIAMISLNVASLHLGQPLRAWRVFLGLRTSWLSREAVLLGKFVGLLGLAALLSWLPLTIAYLPRTLANSVPGWLIESTWITHGLVGLSCVFGVAGLYSSAMIYIATRRVLWVAKRTLPRFFSTAIIPGATLAALTIGLASDPASEAATGAHGIVIGLLMLAAFSGAAKWFFESGWAGLLGSLAIPEGSMDRRRRRLIATRLSRLQRTRQTLGLLSVVLATFAAIAIQADGVSIGWLLVGAASIGFLASETAERLLYFMSVVFDRMPGTLK